jgi:hypothetical protein
MGGFANSEFGQFATQFGQMFPKLNGTIQNVMGQVGQSIQNGGQQPQATQTPQQAPGNAYQGFPMPPYTWHRSMPQFNLNGGNYQPAQPPAGMNFSGGALNLPGWAMQQGGQTGGTASGWKPSITSQNVNGGSGGGGTNAAGILQQGYGYHPTQGFISITPEQKAMYQAQGDAETPRMLTSNPDLFLYWLQNQGGTPYGAQAQGVSGVTGNGPAGTDGGIY